MPPKRTIWTTKKAQEDVETGVEAYFAEEPMRQFFTTYDHNCWGRRPVCQVCETYTYFPFDDAAGIVTWDFAICDTCMSHARENHGILPDLYRIEADGEPHRKDTCYPIKVTCRDCLAKHKRQENSEKKRRDRDRSEEREGEHDIIAKKRRDQAPGNAGGETAGRAAGGDDRGHTGRGGVVQEDTSSMTASEKQKRQQQAQLECGRLLEKEQEQKRKGDTKQSAYPGRKAAAQMQSTGAADRVKKPGNTSSSAIIQGQTAKIQAKPRKLMDTAQSTTGSSRTAKPAASTKSNGSGKAKGFIDMLGKSESKTKAATAQTKTSGSVVAPTPAKSSATSRTTSPAPTVSSQTKVQSAATPAKQKAGSSSAPKTTNTAPKTTNTTRNVSGSSSTTTKSTGSSGSFTKAVVPPPRAATPTIVKKDTKKKKVAVPPVAQTVYPVRKKEPKKKKQEAVQT